MRPARDQGAGERIASFLYVANGFAQASCVAAQAAAARTAGFDETLRQYEDHLFLIRAEALGARVEVSGPALVAQHVDPRPDRMGARDDAARARAFLAAADGLLTRRERMGFALRCLGAALAEERPAQARRLALAGLREGALAGAALKLLLRASVGPEAYARARRTLRGRTRAGRGRRADREA